MMPDSEGAFVRKGAGAEDRRTERTRKALLEAFVALFFDRPYDRITVGAIARRAGVSRSTFYEHYADKEDLLSDSIRAPLSGLASCVDPGRDAEAARRVMKHFWENRAQARLLFAGGGVAPMARVLASMIAERLTARATGASARRTRIVSVAIASSQMGVVASWLRGEATGTPAEIGETLHALARACCRVL